MLICRNAEGVHGKKKVGNPCSTACQAKPVVFPNMFIKQQAQEVVQSTNSSL